MLSLNMTRLAAVALSLTVMTGLAGTAMAQTWEQTHKNRDQVNDRLQNQNHRITEARKNGELSKQEARKLHIDDHQIRREERNFSSHNRGHITKSEQATLNQRERDINLEMSH